jgi:hypothetical protein
MLQIHSFVAVGELAAPPLGGVLYDRTGYGGVLGISVTVLIIDLVMRLLLIEKKVGAAYQLLGRDQHEMPHESDAIRDRPFQTQYQSFADDEATADYTPPSQL